MLDTSLLIGYYLFFISEILKEFNKFFDFTKVLLIALPFGRNNYLANKLGFTEIK